MRIIKIILFLSVIEVLTSCAHQEDEKYALGKDQQGHIIVIRAIGD